LDGRVLRRSIVGKIGWGLASRLLLTQLVMALRRLRTCASTRHLPKSTTSPCYWMRIWPAVIGLPSPIVLPSVVGPRGVVRAVVVQHEREHCPRLVALGGGHGAAAVEPAIWWMAHRLHRNEIDCDARIAPMDPALMRSCCC
jgi:hypothetical protein